MSMLNALKGISGEFELSRLMGASGAGAYILGAHAFLAWSLWHGHDFDLTAYCLSFPTGLGVAVGATAGAVALKDQSVAKARVTSAVADTADAANAPPPPAAGDGTARPDEAEAAPWTQTGKDVE